MSVTPSRLGFINQTSDSSFAQDNALFLKVYAGEVLAAFDETNVMNALHMTRTIDSGKSAQFPVIGKSSAAYHIPGTTLTGANKPNHAERIINIDAKLVDDIYIDEVDEAKNHYDVRSEYSRQQGASLARKFDQQTLQVAVLAARATANVTGGFGGTVLTNASMKTDGSVIASNLFNAAQTLSEKDITDLENVYCVLKPAQYYLVAQVTNVLNRDIGGAGAIAKGTAPEHAGIQIIKSNNVPTTVIAAETGTNNTYDGDFSKTAGVVFHRSAIGTVQLRGLKMESEYKIENQATLMVAKYVLGHGILRPESAIELATP